VGEEALVNRYDFLYRLHRLVRPTLYLEIGVQHGFSMAQAMPETYCVGVDPEPIWSSLHTVIPTSNSYEIRTQTSQEFFKEPHPNEFVDLGFIDGMHLAEIALHDFQHMEGMCRNDSVILLDDVRPYSQDIATRWQPPGDWTGDVWKVYYWLREYRRDLNLRLVNVQPTGLLMVTNLNPERQRRQRSIDVTEQPVPDEILNRVTAQDPEYVLTSLSQERGLA
jgi:hypothetical protein